jgi:preprotein translocase SecE subunit
VEATEKKPNALQRGKQFLSEVWAELRQKTSWPTRKEVEGTTLVVIVAVLFCALYLYVVDYVIVSGLSYVESFLAGVGR